MKGTKAIVGVYTYVDDAIKGITSAKQASKDYEVYSPTFVPALNEAVDKRRSIVGVISLTGGLTGLVCGFALAIWTSMDWPMRTSAKEVISIPGFVVVGYEWCILFGALFTFFGGILLLCRMPNPFRKVGYDPRFSRDKFGVVIGCNEDEVDRFKKELEDSGADEVLVKEGL